MFRVQRVLRLGLKCELPEPEPQGPPEPIGKDRQLWFSQSPEKADHTCDIIRVPGLSAHPHRGVV